MSLSYRIMISMVAGVFFAMFIPIQSFPYPGFWQDAAQIFLIAWRYLVYPFLFFGLIMALAQLRREKRLGLMFFINTILIITLSFIMSFAGTLLATVLPIKRIPVQFEKIALENPTSGLSFLESLLPVNAFSVFSLQSLLPLLILAVLLGMNLSWDKEVTEPSYNLFDSLSRIFYHILSYTMRLAWVPIFFFSVHSVTNLKQQDLSHYTSFLWTVSLSAVTCALILAYVLSKFLTTNKKAMHCWKNASHYWPIAFLSPNIHLNACIASYNSHQNSKIKRDLGGLTSPYFALFARCGSVFVCSMAMVTILRSYSSLSLGISQVLGIFICSFLASFMTGHSPERSLVVMLPIACMMYGKPLTSGSHILEPIIFHITILASFIDSMFIMFALNFISHFKKIEKKSALKIRNN